MWLCFTYFVQFCECKCKYVAGVYKERKQAFLRRRLFPLYYFIVRLWVLGHIHRYWVEGCLAFEDFVLQYYATLIFWKLFIEVLTLMWDSSKHFISPALLSERYFTVFLYCFEIHHSRPFFIFVRFLLPFSLFSRSYYHCFLQFGRRHSKYISVGRKIPIQCILPCPHFERFLFFHGSLPSEYISCSLTVSESRRIVHPCSL